MIGVWGLGLGQDTNFNPKPQVDVADIGKELGLVGWREAAKRLSRDIPLRCEPVAWVYPNSRKGLAY